MALLVANHSVVFTVMTEEQDADGTVLPPSEGASFTVVGQMEPMSAQAAFEQFGVEVTRPFKFRYEVADEAKVKMGYRATFEGRKFTVAGPPRPHKGRGAFAALDYMDCVLGEGVLK